MKAVRRFRWEASAPFAGRLVFDFIVFVPFTSLSVCPLMFICLTVLSVSPVVILNMKMDRGRTGRWIYQLQLAVRTSKLEWRDLNLQP